MHRHFSSLNARRRRLLAYRQRRSAGGRRPHPKRHQKVCELSARDSQARAGLWRRRTRNGHRHACGACLARSRCSRRRRVIAKYYQVRSRQSPVADEHLRTVAYHIMFLDQLRQEYDRPTIQMLGIRLMAGQGTNGGWTYDCGNPLSAEEETQLKKIFGDESLLKSGAANEPNKGAASLVRPDLPPPEPKTDVGDKATPAPAPKEEKPTLHPVVAKWLNKLVNAGKVGGNGDGDNLNTQFAARPLVGPQAWRTLRQGPRRTRSCASAPVNADGSWGYQYQTGTKDTMTCPAHRPRTVAKGSTMNVMRNKVNKPDPAKKDGKDPLEATAASRPALSVSAVSTGSQGSAGRARRSRQATAAIQGRSSQRQLLLSLVAGASCGRLRAGDHRQPRLVYLGCRLRGGYATSQRRAGEEAIRGTHQK